MSTTTPGEVRVAFVSESTGEVEQVTVTVPTGWWQVPWPDGRRTWFRDRDHAVVLWSCLWPGKRPDPEWRGAIPS